MQLTALKFPPSGLLGVPTEAAPEEARPARSWCGLCLGSGSAFGGEWDGDDIKLHPGFDVLQLVALYHHLCTYPPIFRF